MRRTYEPALYVTVTHTLYRYFGIVGATFEVGAVVGAVIWAAGLGRSRPTPPSARRWAVAGAACLVLAHALFWLLVYPVSQEFAAWTPVAVPADWTRLRDQWELTHAARAGLFLLGFCGLFSVRSGSRGENTG